MHGYDLGDFAPWGEGYPAGADGVYGSNYESNTATAVANFQEDRDIEDMVPKVGAIDAFTSSLILGAQRNELLPQEPHGHKVAGSVTGPAVILD